MSSFGFGLMEALFPVFFTITFLIVIGMFAFMLIKEVTQWNKNNASPVLTVDAKLVAKREHVSRSSHHNGAHTHHSTSTSYHATFEVESKDRMEFRLDSREYGMLAEGDTGRLTFQGTRYHGFERTR